MPPPRIVEYSPFPRTWAGRDTRLGLTRDHSAAGMCIVVDAPHEIGSLLRVSMRGSDSLGPEASVQRVAWCSEARDGRFWLGLERLEELEGR